MKSLSFSSKKRRSTRLAAMLVAQLAAVSFALTAPVPQAYARTKAKSSDNKKKRSNGNGNGNAYGRSGQTPQGNAYGRSGQTPRGNAYGRTGQTPRGNAYGRSGQTPRGNAYGRTGQTPRGNGHAYGRSGQAPRGNANGHYRSSTSSRGSAHTHYRTRATTYAPRSRVVHRGPVAYYTPGHSTYVVSQGHSTYYAAPAPASSSVEVVHRPYADTFDLGLGVGAVWAAPQLQSSLPMINGKIRMLGQVTPGLGLGVDLDASSLLFVNHLTANAVVSYDLLANSPVTLRPYLSMGGGALHFYDGAAHYLGPALSARAGIELKPISWFGLGLEGGAVGAIWDGAPQVVPFVGGTLSLYLL